MARRILFLWVGLCACEVSGGPVEEAGSTGVSDDDDDGDGGDPPQGGAESGTSGGGDGEASSGGDGGESGEPGGEESGGSTTTGPADQPGGCPTLLAEDFEGIDLGLIPDGWVWGGGGWAVEAEDGGRVLVGTGPNVIVGFGESAWTDYEVTMRIRFEPGEFPSKILTYVRYDTATDVLWAFKNFSSNTIFDRALHDTGGPWQVTASHTMAPGTWNDFRIRAEGTRAEIAINGEVVITTDDDGADHGLAGLYLWESGRVRVDDIVVSCL